jgi:hypothetical protein
VSALDRSVRTAKARVRRLERDRDRLVLVEAGAHWCVEVDRAVRGFRESKGDPRSVLELVPEPLQAYVRQELDRVA